MNKNVLLRKGALFRSNTRQCSFLAVWRQPVSLRGTINPSGLKEFYVKGITEVIGRVPFYGGTAADNTIEGKWKLFTDKGVFADGVAVAFFYTNKKMANKFTGAYRETKDMGVITKVIDHRILAEIDGIPALQKYAEWRGMDVEALKGGALLSETITSPYKIIHRPTGIYFNISKTKHIFMVIL